jgi:hypothetical protein
MTSRHHVAALATVKICSKEGCESHFLFVPSLDCLLESTEEKTKASLSYPAFLPLLFGSPWSFGCRPAPSFNFLPSASGLKSHSPSSPFYIQPADPRRTSPAQRTCSQATTPHKPFLIPTTGPGLCHQSMWLSFSFSVALCLILLVWRQLTFTENKHADHHASSWSGLTCGHSLNVCVLQHSCWSFISKAPVLRSKS